MSKEYNNSAATGDIQQLPNTGGIKKGYLYAFLITISLGSFQFGYSIGVFNTLQDSFAAQFNWTVDEKANQSALVTAICSIGSAIGAIGAGPLAEKGRWFAILVTNIPLVIGVALTLSGNFPTIVVGRFIYGVSSGSFSVFVPKFISETAPVELKGPVGVMTQLFITVGIMVSFIFGLALPKAPEIDWINPKSDWNLKYKDDWMVLNYWRFMFGFPLIVAALQIILMVSVFKYDTPKFLKQKKRNVELNAVMGKLYDSSRVQDRIASISVEESGSDVNSESTQPGYRETLFSPRYQVATLVGCTLSGLQQLSGINAVMFYSSTIFANADFDPRVATSLVGIVNVVSTFASSFLLTFFGRRTLLWSMSFAMAIDLIFLGIAFQTPGTGPIQIVLVLLFVVLFEFSLGPIVWIYMSEIMTDKGQSIGTLVNWILTIIMASCTPILLRSISGNLFIIFGVCCAICGIFSLSIVKETMGLTEIQVANLYNRHTKRYQDLEATTSDEGANKSQ